MAKGVGVGGGVAAFAWAGVGGGVIGDGGDIGQIGTWAVHGQDLAVVVVGVGVDARCAGERGTETLTAIGVGGGLFYFLAEDADGLRAGGGGYGGRGGRAGDNAAVVGVAVINVGGDFLGFGAFDG